MTPESRLLHSVRERLGARTDCTVLRLNSGKARSARTGQVVTFGVEGMADLLVLVDGGRYAWLELKAGTRQRPAQRVFEQMVQRRGGTYAVVRTVEEAEGVIACLLR